MWLKNSDFDFKVIGKMEVCSGSTKKVEIAVDDVAKTSKQILQNIINALIEFFGESSGYIGVCYHGRTISNMDNIINNFARVLPVGFDKNNKYIFEHSYSLAAKTQATSIFEIQKIRNIAYPKIVFQTIFNSSLDDRIFSDYKVVNSIGKFQIVFNLIKNDDGEHVECYFDKRVYSSEEIDKITGYIDKYIGRR